MEKKICIVHYNTPALTTCLIKSINKHTPGTTIYLFDNSDKKPFKNRFDNVTVFNNTNGQIIDFEKWLSKYPNRKKSAGAVNNFGSAKHCYTVQKCIELIDDNFVLLDSDILLKKDISGIWDSKYVWVGGVEKWSAHLNKKRACPFVLYLNVKKMKENDITFFSDTHMFGLKNGDRCEEYDTGCWLYEQTGVKNRKIIRYQDYITHFRAGSWLDDARKKQHYKQMEPKKWLIVHKKCWAGHNDTLNGDWYEKIETGNMIKEEEKKTETDAIFNSVFDHIYCLHYLPYSDRLPKLKSELERVGINENADYFSWVYDYPSQFLDLVFEDDRLKLSLALRSSSRPFLKKVALKHYEIAKDAYEKGYKRILVLEDDIRFHKDISFISKMLSNVPDNDIIMFDKMVASSSKETAKYNKRIREAGKDALYASMDDIFFIFTSCYSLNRNGMRHIIEQQEKSLLPPDTPFNDTEITGSFAVLNLAIQDPKLKNIEKESYKKIGLDLTMYNCDDVKEETEKQVKKQIISVRRKPVSSIRSFRMSHKNILERKPVRYEVIRTPSKIYENKQEISVPVEEKTKVHESAKPMKTRKIVHTRIVHGRSKTFNKLYDV